MKWKSGKRNTKKLRSREKRVCRNERILREMCDHTKQNNIHIMGHQKRTKKREKGMESALRK